MPDTSIEAAASLHPSPALSFHLLQPASDRMFWEERLTRLSPALREEIHERIDQAKAYEIQSILASHYRTYMETGDRQAFEAVLFPRRRHLAFLAVGAGVLNDKSCLGPLEDLIWATCEETTWVTPPVTRGLPSHKDDAYEVELTPAMTGLLLASIVDLLGDQLDERVKARISDCLLERVIRPFVDKDYWWLNPPPGRRLNNWTAVCSAGALACATLVPSLVEHRQAVIDQCFEPLTRYMETFDTQGGCEEGGSYWVYAVDYLTLAAELLRMDPQSPDLYAHPRFKAIAQFPPRIFLGNKQWITFSDCRQTPRINLSTLAKLDERLDVPATGNLARRCEAHLAFFAKEGTLLHTLAWWPDLSNPPAQSLKQKPKQTSANSQSVEPEACVYFPGIEWMVSRVDPSDDNTLVLSAHAGHNGFSHNHNDVGHVSVYSQTLPLLADLGVPVYDRDYFSEKRITYFVASSKGHSVPQVNSQLQLRGPEYASKVLGQSHSQARDELVMDLKNAYGNESGLASLTRSISLDRPTNASQATNPQAASADKGMVSVTDDFTFATDTPNRWQFTSAAITTGSVSILAPGQLLIENSQAKGLFAFDPQIIDCQLEEYPQVKLNESVINCTRLCLSLRKPAQAGRISWTLTPR